MKLSDFDIILKAQDCGSSNPGRKDSSLGYRE